MNNAWEKCEIILGVVKRNPLFFHSISCKNNEFLFTIPNISLNCEQLHHKNKKKGKKYFPLPYKRLNR